MYIYIYVCIIPKYPENYTIYLYHQTYALDNAKKPASTKINILKREKITHQTHCSYRTYVTSWLTILTPSPFFEFVFCSFYNIYNSLPTQRRDIEVELNSFLLEWKINSFLKILYVVDWIIYSTRRVLSAQRIHFSILPKWEDAESSLQRAYKYFY